MKRTASCRCGQLSAKVTGEPVRVSVCHCLNCKKRSGSAFAAQARWPRDLVTFDGRFDTFDKAGDSGSRATFHFCPLCGSDVWYVTEDNRDNLVAIPIGAFDDPLSFEPPSYSVYEQRKLAWVEIVGDDIEHYD